MPNHEERFFSDKLPDLIKELKPHDHLCLIYESRDEWLETIVPFILSGLERGEKCIYVVDANTADEMRMIFQETGLDLDKIESSGQFSIIHERDAYTREGFFDPDLMIALLIEETEKALAEGYSALRVTGEMSWALRDYSGVDRVLEYEASLNRDFFPRYRCLAICQYDRWKFDPETIKGVVLTHPLLIRGGCIYRNFYYIEPEEYLNHKKGEREVQHWLNNLERERKIQESLRESEDKYHSLFEQSVAGIYLHDFDGNIVDVNQEACIQLGYSREELLKMAVFDFHPREDTVTNLPKEEILKQWAKWSPGEKHVLEAEHRRKDGTVFPAQVITGVVQYGSKKLILAMVQDISERRQAESRLLLEQKEKDLILKNLAEQVTYLDHDMRIVWANPRAEKKLSARCNDYKGRKCHEVYHGTDKPCSDCPISSVFETGIAGGGVHRANDGTYWQMYGTPIHDDNGKLVGVLDTALDISNLKQQEQALQEEHDRLNYILGITATGVNITDADYNLRYVDEQWQKIYGDPSGKKCYQYFMARNNPCFNCGILEALETKEVIVKETVLPRENNRIIEVHTIPFCNQEGEWLVAEFNVDITRRKEAEEMIRKRNIELETLLSISSDLRAAETLDKMLPRLLDQTLSALDAPAGAIWIYHPLVDKLRFSVARGWYTVLEKEFWDPDESIAGKVYTSGKEYISSDVSNDPLVLSDFSSRIPQGWSGFYLPVKSGELVVGVMAVSASQSRNLSAEEIRLLRSLAEIAGIAIHRLNVYEDLEKSNLELYSSYEDTIEGWSRALDLRDHETVGHSERVADMTIALALKLGISHDELVHIRRGCLLHDIGKMAISDTILLKPEQLNTDERALMEKHPQVAYNLLSPISYLVPALDIPYCHHEKWDGSGYPRGLKGEEIPLAARIFAVVDVFDALTSDRPYRPAWQRDKALKYIYEQSGKHFDSQVVAAFLEAIENANW